MSWAEIKKAVNSDLSTPLNSKIDAQTTTLANKFGLELVEVASISSSNTFSRSYDAIAVPTSISSGATIYKGTTTTGKKIFNYNGGNGSVTPFFKIEKNTNYYVSGSTVQLVFYKLGGGYLTFLKTLQAQTLRKGVC